MKVKIDLIWLILAVVLLFVIVRQCEGEPKTITKTETIVKWKTDTVRQTKIQKVKEPVYVEKVKTLKGDTVVVFKEKETQTTVEANRYKTEIKSDSATAKLDITTTGELLDVKGVITYPRIEKTVETLKLRNKSGLFIYGQLPVQNLKNPEIGLQYNIRNTIFLSSGVQLDPITNNPNINVGIGVKIF